MTRICGDVRASNVGDRAPDGSSQLELALSCPVRINSSLYVRSPVTQHYALLFSCINSLTFTVLVKVYPLFWAFFDLSRLRLIMLSEELVTVVPLQHSMNAAGMEFPKISPYAGNERDASRWNAVLHFQLSADNRAALQVWLDGLFMTGAARG